MKLRTPLIRAALAATLVATSFAIDRVPAAPAADARAALATHVDARAPMHATLLPELRVGSRDGDAQLDAGDALPVTLLPTVHVTASMRDFAALPARDTGRDATLLLAARD